MEALLVGEIPRKRVLKISAEHTGTLEPLVIALQCACDDRVEAGNWGAEESARSGFHDAARSGACSTRSQSSAAGTGTDLCTDAAHAAARSILHYSEIDTKNLGTGFSPQHVGISDIEVVSRNGDVEIVLQGERNGIVQRKIELAVGASSWSMRAVLARLGSATCLGM